MTTKEVGDAPCTWPKCSQPANGVFWIRRGENWGRRGLCWEHLALVIVYLRWNVMNEAPDFLDRTAPGLTSNLKEGSDANTKSR